LTWSLEYISGGLAAIIAALVPLFITIFTLWLSTCVKISKWMIVGMVVGLAGVVIIFYDYLGELHNKNFILGVTLALLATLSWSYGTVYSSRQKLPVDILFSVGLQMLSAGIIILIACGLTGRSCLAVCAGLPDSLWVLASLFRVRICHIKTITGIGVHLCLHQPHCGCCLGLALIAGKIEWKYCAGNICYPWRGVAGEP
jgi:drug/metabolite transporter (DMT)-like permease